MANDGAIKSVHCSWSQFGHMPRALEIYQRDGGESLNPEVKPMIVLFCKLGKQAQTHWRGRKIIENSDAIDYIIEYQGVIFGTATGGRHMVLAIALVRGESVPVVFPSIDTYRIYRADIDLSPEEREHLAKYSAIEASKFALNCDSSSSTLVSFPHPP
ncbi:uncharacterized protein MCYG_07124 [Microsporum canis CBS 113480]|uniref:Uncharacterized protein n=1 Tax=Arthroderma otae (strain ATCC MYA-4605 / CBS 113480) TaxID=554155 RepID=C5FWM1_ARTOC|nr:uncharacterized protein MCYG_07124 [Microsporum canis CBS 113480]EEQ34305.1 predicted protein [Microsporum canis CBS 113480]